MFHSNFLMVWNKQFDVSYEINPWMTGNILKVDNRKAYEQWCHLLDVLHNVDAVVDTFSVDNASIPDIVFTANAGFLHENLLTVSRFKYSQRLKEVPYYVNWFLTHTKAHHQFIPDFFEGAGDALTDVNGNLWAGYGFRSDLESHGILRILYPKLNVISLNLTNPDFYHLDTCFCPLNNGYVMYYPEAFLSDSELKILEAFGDKVILIEQRDAKNFACNAIEWDGNLIMNRCSAKLNYELEKIGYNVIETDLTEFIKAGGSAKCLTLKLSETHFPPKLKV